MKTFQRTLLPSFWLLVGTAAIGLAPIFVRWSLVGPVATGFWRLAIASTFIFLPSLRSGSPTQTPWFWSACLAGIAFGGDLGVWHLAVKKTSVANATLLANLAPIFMLLFAQVFLGESIRKQIWFAIALSFSGVLLLLGNGLSLHGNPGDAFGLCAALFYSAYLLILRRIPASAASLSVLGVSSICGALVLFPFAWFLEKDFFPKGAVAWEVLVGLALVSQILGQGLITRNLPRVPVSLSSAILVCQSAFAAFAGWWLLGETLGPLRILGAGLMISGIFFVRVLGLRSALPAVALVGND